MDPLARPHLARVTPYAPGTPLEQLERDLGITDAVKLASNESPLGPSPAAVAAMAEALGQAHRYPDPDAFDLRQRLAEVHCVEPGELCFGNGSNELIDLLCRAFTGPEQHAVIAAPSFIAYKLCLALSNARVTEVPLDVQARFDIAGMLAAVEPTTRLLFLDNPNNPASTHVVRDELARLLEDLPEHVVPVIDEAYFHYADAPDYASALELRERHPRTTVLRTFSKAHGLAALRAGYLIGPRGVVDALQRVRAPFNMNAIAQVGALASLTDGGHLARVVEHNRRERALVTKELERSGLWVASSQANFVFARLPAACPLDAAAVYDRLLRRGVITRTVGGAPRHLRITVGLAEENRRMLEALRGVLS